MDKKKIDQLKHETFMKLTGLLQKEIANTIKIIRMPLKERFELIRKLQLQKDNEDWYEFPTSNETLSIASEEEYEFYVQRIDWYMPIGFTETTWTIENFDKLIEQNGVLNRYTQAE